MEQDGGGPAERRDSNDPATQRDLATWGGRLTERIDRVESAVNGLNSRIDRLEQRMDRQDRGLQAVLDIVTQSNALLKSLRDLPERVTRLERIAFK